MSWQQRASSAQASFASLHAACAFLTRHCKPAWLLLVVSAAAVDFAEAVVVLRPSMEDFHKLEPDKIVVRHLDVGTTRMISHVLGQSVALDYYNS